MTFKNIFLIAIILAASGCKSNKAFNYHQKIVEMEKGLIPEMTRTENKVLEYYQEQNFTGISKASAKMQKLINKTINEIKELEEPEAEGIKEYKKSTLQYFTFLKKIYFQYQKYADAETDADRQEAYNEFNTIKEQKLEVADDFKAAQKEFAKANNFKLEEKGKRKGEGESKKKKDDE